MWEDLFNAFPNAKVILTVRDSDDQFVKSWNKFQDMKKIKLKHQTNTEDKNCSSQFSL